MIDEEKLIRIAKELDLFDKVNKVGLELTRLARLGEWAEQYAIPALQWEDKRCGKVFGPLGDALKAIPKDGVWEPTTTGRTG